jgi:hypothetical protein
MGQQSRCVHDEKLCIAAPGYDHRPLERLVRFRRTIHPGQNQVDPDTHF